MTYYVLALSARQAREYIRKHEAEGAHYCYLPDEKSLYGLELTDENVIKLLGWEKNRAYDRAFIALLEFKLVHQQAQNE